MATTGDQYLVKRINKSLVLSLLQTQSPISRAKISETIGLNKATVSTLVAELIDSHLAYEVGEGASSGGRKPVMVAFRADAGAAVGVDLEVDELRALLIALDGRVIAEASRAWQSPTAEEAAGVIADIVREWRALPAVKAMPYGLVGLGVGLPGIVDAEGRLLFAPNLGWREEAMRERLERALGLPVFADNEANAAAVGECAYGVGRDVADLIYISAGYGIGAGIVLQNDLFRGFGGFSGEIGHMTVERDGRRCSCGNSGCWEMYASEHALLSMASRDEALMNELVSRGEPLAPEALLALAADGSSAARRLFARIGEALGIGVANLVNVFNPRMVVIGNRLAKAEPWIRDAMLREVRKRALSFHREGAAIRFSMLGANAPALGAAYFAVNEFLGLTKISVAPK